MNPGQAKDPSNRVSKPIKMNNPSNDANKLPNIYIYQGKIVPQLDGTTPPTKTTPIRVCY